MESSEGDYRAVKLVTRYMVMVCCKQCGLPSVNPHCSLTATTSIYHLQHLNNNSSLDGACLVTEPPHQLNYKQVPVTN